LRRVVLEWHWRCHRFWKWREHSVWQCHDCKAEEILPLHVQLQQSTYVESWSEAEASGMCLAPPNQNASFLQKNCSTRSRRICASRPPRRRCIHWYEPRTKNHDVRIVAIMRLVDVVVVASTNMLKLHADDDDNRYLVYRLFLSGWKSPASSGTTTLPPLFPRRGLQPWRSVVTTLWSHVVHRPPCH
jgi:hypothetical protein